MRKIEITLILLLLTSFGCKQIDQNILDLSGTWTYRLDSIETGEENKWYTQDFESTIELPGALRDYCIGNKPDLNTDWTGSIYDSSWYFNPAMEKYRQKDNLKIPFWLTPVTHYKGMAWYQKIIQIPNSWEGHEVLLFLEYPHWQTTVWVNNHKIGNGNSLSTPHQFVIPATALSAGKNRLTIRVDNALREIDPGINSHSVSDHTQGNWNGIVGQLSMQVLPQNYIKRIKTTPSLSEDAVNVEIVLSEPMKNGSLNFQIKGLNHNHNLPETTQNWEGVKDTLHFKLSMGSDYKTWSEFSPDLYEMTVSLEGILDKESINNTQTTQFGMREFTLDKHHFYINGIPTFLRGTTDCSVFPLTGYPPTEEKDWARIFKICKDFGLNHVRFHSYCPPQAAFKAADKAGIYLQVEGPSWAKYSTSLGNGRPIDAYLMEETQRIIDAYGNHPSFCMMAYGNEPSGNYVPYLENWVDHFKTYDPQRLFTGASTGRSWAIIENSDFIVRSPPRGLEWNYKQPESLFDYRNKTENQERPYVTFEMGQWCVFPNFKEIEKYTGSLKAKNFELFQEDLNDKQMGDLAEDFLMASGKLQASCYKQEIEATLRTPNLAGFQLLSLNDFSGQGSALVGVLDAFWDEKGYISAEEFKEFSNEVVPLARLEKFTFESTETLNANVEVANFSGALLSQPEASWQLTNKENTLIKEGKFSPTDIPMGQCHPIGTIELGLDFVDKAQQFTLSISVGSYHNSWKVWVYPPISNKQNHDGLFVTDEIGSEAQAALNQGKSVLLLVAGKVENGKDIVQYHTPVFWNTSWFRMRPPHTTGLLIQEKHPVFKEFPTDYYSDMQWWELTNRQQVMNLENFPSSFRPQVQPIDTWLINRRLAMLFEAQVGNGKLIVCSIDLSDKAGQGPAARQLKQSILNYMSSDTFKPAETVSYDIIEELFEIKERETWKSYVNNEP